LAFGDPNTETHASRTSVACDWAGGTNDTQNTWGVVIGGEWSNAINKYVLFAPLPLFSHPTCLHMPTHPRHSGPTLTSSCGKWLNGVNGGNSYDQLPGGLGCEYWEDWQKWSPQLKQDIMNYNLAQTDALAATMFWTWRIAVSEEKGYATSPQWHYKLGVEQGWISPDPRRAAGFCRSRGAGGGVVRPSASLTGSLHFVGSMRGACGCWAKG
jgi:hypothetical protein